MWRGARSAWSAPITSPRTEPKNQLQGVRWLLRLDTLHRQNFILQCSDEPGAEVLDDGVQAVQASVVGLGDADPYRGHAEIRQKLGHSFCKHLFLK